MSLNKTQRHLLRLREENRRLRSSGLAPLTDPGPWFAVATAFRFDPEFFPGLLDVEIPPDTTVIGEDLP